MNLMKKHDSRYFHCLVELEVQIVEQFRDKARKERNRSFPTRFISALVLNFLLQFCQSTENSINNILTKFAPLLSNF